MILLHGPSANPDRADNFALPVAQRNPPGKDHDPALVAAVNAEEAAHEWIAEAERMGRVVPDPSTPDKFSGKWVMRVPKSLHASLSKRAKTEGVSLNAFASTLLAEGLGKRTARTEDNHAGR